MRVLVVTSTFPRSSGDSQPAFVYDLCRFLHAQGVFVDVIAPHADGCSRQETMQGIHVYRYRYFFGRLQTLAYNGGILANLKKNRLNYLLIPFFVMAQCFAVWQRVRKQQYDVIHAHWIIPQAAICILLKSCMRNRFPAVLCTSHGGDLYALNGFTLQQLKRWTLYRIDQLAVVSRAMKQYAIASLSMATDRIQVMPMGVDLKYRFKPVDNVVREPLRIIFVGRLVDKKGAVHAIDAVHLLHRDFPGLELVIAGDGPLRESLQQRVKTLELEASVRFLGSVTQQELPALYSSASIAVVPSVIDERGDQEGLGLVAIEAMGCGCAVVVSSMAAMGDIVSDGDTGLVFNMGSIEDLANKLRFLLQHPDERQLMAQRGREYVKQRYDWHAIAAQYRVLLENVISL